MATHVSLDVGRGPWGGATPGVTVSGENGDGATPVRVDGAMNM